MEDNILAVEETKTAKKNTSKIKRVGDKDGMIVRVANKVQKVNLGGMSETAINVFWACMALLKNKGTDTIQMNATALRKATNINKHTSIAELSDWLKVNVRDKLNLSVEVKDISSPNAWESINLFSVFKFDGKDTFEIKLNADFVDFVNNFGKENPYTEFGLNDIVNVHGKYAKIIFYMLKMYKYVGVVEISKDELMKKLNVPASTTTRKFNQAILKPSIATLSSFFNNLECETIYSASDSRRISGYKFTFTPETRTKRLTTSMPILMKAPSLDEVNAYKDEMGYSFDAEAFLTYNSSTKGGWTVEKIANWKKWADQFEKNHLKRESSNFPRRKLNSANNVERTNMNYEALAYAEEMDKVLHGFGDDHEDTKTDETISDATVEIKDIREVSDVPSSTDDKSSKVRKQIEDVAASAGMSVEELLKVIAEAKK